MKHPMLHAILRQSALAVIAFGLACSGGVPESQAQSYPARPIRVIIPYPPGNTSDILARLIGPKLTERLGQQVIVENHAGASGQIGLDLAARAAPDGYTLTVGQGGNLVVAPHTYKKLPYDPLKDFAPVALLATNYLVVVAYPDAPFKTVTEMIAWAKANPGKLTVASNGEGGFPHLAFEHLRVTAGFTFQHIPYKGTAQIVTDLMGGQVQVGIDGISGMAPHVRSGRLRLLAITNPVRVPLWPDTATVTETVPGYDSRGWFGFLAPAGTPPAIVARLNAEINRAMRLPDVADKMIAAGLIIVTESPEFFGDMIKSDYAKYGQLARDIGFQPQ